jgi:hypothetical protein
MAEAARHYASYLNSPHRLHRSEVIPHPPRKWKLPPGAGLQWADEQDEQQQDVEMEFDENGRPVTPPPPLVVDLDDTQRNRDVAAAMNRCLVCV